MVLLVFLLQFSHAEQATLLRFFPGEILRNEIVEFQPIKEHHFNLEAPQNCGSGVISDKSPRAIKCQFARPGPTQATLNVCDDKQTFCRPMLLNINVIDRGGGVADGMLTKNEHLNKELKQTLVPGFVSGSVVQLSAQAAAKGGPVFVMVSTDWCPPCNESKEFLLSSAGFKEATRDWLKIYVDGDSVQAGEWNQAAPFRYFPTFVLLNAQMQEVARYTGEIRQGEFSEWAKRESLLMRDPIPALQTRVKARLQGSLMQKLKDLVNGAGVSEKSADQERLLAWVMDREQDELARTLIAKGSYPKLQIDILNYQLSALDKSETPQNADTLKTEKLAMYRQLLAATFTGEHWGQFAAGLCELDAGACKELQPKIAERLQFLSHPDSLSPAEKDSQLGDEYFYIAQIYDALKDKAGIKEFGLKCAEHFSAMQKGSLLKISRAGQQGMVACLEIAGEYAREEAALKALVEAYPTEPTFLSRMARMLRKQKRPAEALRFINQAETVAYGYNWFALRLLKAEIYLDLKKAGEARKVVDETLAEVRLDGDQDGRNQRLVTRLRSMQAQAGEDTEQ